MARRQVRTTDSIIVTASLSTAPNGFIPAKIPKYPPTRLRRAQPPTCSTSRQLPKVRNTPAEEDLQSRFCDRRAFWQPPAPDAPTGKSAKKPRTSRVIGPLKMAMGRSVVSPNSVRPSRWTAPRARPVSTERSSPLRPAHEQLTTPCLVVIPCSHAWNAASVGAHNPVPERSSQLSLSRPVNEPGNAPSRPELPARFILVSLLRLPNADGTEPVNWLWPRAIPVRLLRFAQR